MKELNKILQQVDDVIAKGPYLPTWESLADYPVATWYRDAKLGIFSHFGVYTVAEFGSEWYSRNMYIEGSRANEYHKKKYGEPKDFGYHQLIDEFKAEKFKADEWLKIIKNSGAKYYIPVAEHHDGVQIHNSVLSKYNTKQMGPKIDFIEELKKASEKSKIKFGLSNHRAEHYFFMEGGLNFDSGINNPKYGELYWPTISLSELEEHPQANELFLKDWLGRVCEEVMMYNPQVVYFDWWIETPMFKPYLLKFAAFYYNWQHQQKTSGIINYKHDAYMYSCAVRDMERGQFTDIQPDYWQACTSISNNSWSYTKNNTYKSTKEIVQTLCDVVAKNGNLLLNIGPRADGTICEQEQEVLEQLGSWLALNGAAIYGSRPWKVFGEGPTNIEGGDFSEGQLLYCDLDYRFTRRADKLYIIAMNPLPKEKVKIRSLRKKKGVLKTHGVILGVKVLGGTVIKYKREPYSFDIEYKHDNYDLPIVFELTMG